MQQVEARGPTQAQDPLGMGARRPLRGVTPWKLIIPHDIAYLCLQVSTSKGVVRVSEREGKKQWSHHMGCAPGAQIWSSHAYVNRHDSTHMPASLYPG